MTIQRLSRQLCIAIAAMALTTVASAQASEYCKWTDPDGVVHFAERCPEDVTSTTIETQDVRTPGQIQAAEAHSKSLLSANPTQRREARQSGKYRSLSWEELGPLPPSEKSDYIDTSGWYTVDTGLSRGRAAGQLIVSVNTNRKVPEGAWLEAAFPDPANIAVTNRVAEEAGPDQKFMLESPSTEHLKCWNYPVEVRLYSDPSKEVLIDSVRQVIQSRMNIALWRDLDDVVRGMTNEYCTENEFGGKSAAELEGLCQQAREKRLAPEREKLVAECMETRDRSEEFCRNFHANHGDAKRVQRWMQPALYMDLPECVAAREAKAEAK